MGCFLSKSLASVGPDPINGEGEGHISYAGLKGSSIAPEPKLQPIYKPLTKILNDESKEDDSHLQYKDVSELKNSHNIIAAVKRGDLEAVKTLTENDEYGNGINSTGISDFC